MSIDLSPQTQQYIDQQVALGRYNSPAEMIDAAVVALRDSELQPDELRALLQSSHRRGQPR